MRPRLNFNFESVCLSIHLSIRLSVCMYARLSVCMSICLSDCVSMCLSVVCLSIRICMYGYLSVCLRVCLSVYLYACLSFCVSVCLPACLSYIHDDFKLLFTTTIIRDFVLHFSALLFYSPLFFFILLSSIFYCLILSHFSLFTLPNIL